MIYVSFVSSSSSSCSVFNDALYLRIQREFGETSFDVYTNGGEFFSLFLRNHNNLEFDTKNERNSFF